MPSDPPPASATQSATQNARLLRALRWLAASGLTALVYFWAGRLGQAVPDGNGFIVNFWPAVGIALAIMVRWGPSLAPAVFAGAVALNTALGWSAWLALAVALGNTAGPLAAALWLTRAKLHLRLEQRRDLLLLIGAGSLGATVITAANGAAWLAISGQISALNLPVAAFQWWVSDTLGLFVAGIPLLTLTRSGLRQAFGPGLWGRSVLLLAATALSVALALALPQGATLPALALLMLPVLLLAWLAMRAGVGPASTVVLALAVVMLLALALGIGPFVTAEPGDGVQMVLAWLALLSSLVLLTHVQVGELSRLDERWRLALKGSDLGVADWQLAAGTGVTTARWRSLMGDTDESADISLGRWLQQMHIEDRESLRSALFDPALPLGEGLRREVRVRVGEAWRWLDLHAIVAERDASGAPLRIVASLADLALRRDAEERQQLSSNVFMHLHEGLVVTDAEMRVLDANPAYCRIVGISHNELIGQVPGLLRPSAADAQGRPLLAHLLAALHSSGSWVGEVTERRRSGEACALHVTVSTVSAPDGGLRYHVLVVTDVTEQRLQRERLERQALYDELTRLPNRARLGQLLSEAMAATDRDGSLLAVCYLDLDHFKAVNDRHGHIAGDQLLSELANRLRSALRARSTAWSDSAARLGGDEFVLLLRAGTVEEARAAVERVLRVVAQPVELRPGMPPELVTASVGATLYPLDGSDADTLLRHADQAMYSVKQSGRNGFLFFDPEHSRRHQERVLAIGRVQEALDRNELVLYYQPKVDLKRGTVLGVEALLRWNHPEHGLVPPVQFLPLIEHTGLSARVGDHVLGQALDQLEIWLQQGLDLSVSVNITARHLYEPDFAQRLSELLGRHPRPLGQRLELEVLETAALDDVGRTAAVLERCAQLGVRWALDDFGTGYSTLTYLKRLPVQVLKIDRSFVQNMLVDRQDRAIVEGVLSLSRTFGCVVVAEGVETAAQARMLLDMGCEIGQGIGIAAPMPAADVGPWVRDWKGLFALTAAPLPAAPVDAGSDASARGKGKD